MNGEGYGGGGIKGIGVALAQAELKWSRTGFLLDRGGFEVDPNVIDVPTVSLEAYVICYQTESKI